MSGYKRVNFYELCRLCASNQAQNKTHIFQAEGRRIQLQTKIQSLLSLKVREDDCLPKVVCYECLCILETCYTFRTECVTSETMLSTYFNNYRCTDDFKRNGEVYIKDKKPQKIITEGIRNAEIVAVVPATPPSTSPEITNVVVCPLITKKELTSEACYVNPECNIPNWSDTFTNPEKKPIEYTDAMSIEKPELVAQHQAKKYECDVCHKSFKRREHLYQHEKLHSGYRPFTCRHCNKAFMRKEHMLRHVTSHTGLKNYQCDICSKAFSRNDNLLKHKKTHEKANEKTPTTNDRDFICEVCGRRFIRKHYYIEHKMLHTIEGVDAEGKT